MPKRSTSTTEKPKKTKKAKYAKYSESDPMPISDTNLNKMITDELEVVLQDYKTRGENVFKIRNTIKAIANLKQWGVKIVDEETAKLAQRLDGVGKGTVEQILQILEHGTSDRAAQAVVESSTSSIERGKQELLKLMDVGEKTADRLVSNNIQSVADLRKAIMSGSVVLSQCHVPESAQAHAMWVEETSQPVEKESAETIREAVHKVASKHGITSTEISGAFACDVDEAKSVKLLLIKDGWHWTTGRINKIGPRSATMVKQALKKGEDSTTIPNLEAIVQALEEEGIAQARIKTNPHRAEIVVVPGVKGKVEPAGVLADAGRTATAPAPASSSSSSRGKGGVKAEKSDPASGDDGDGESEHEAAPEPADTSMAATASSSSSSSSSSNAAALLAKGLADVDDLEAKDEAAQVASGWSDAAAAATSSSSSSPAAHSSQSAGPTAAQAVTKASAAGEEDTVSREELLAQAREARGWLEEKFADTIVKAKREQPYGVLVELVLVPGNYAVSARILQSFSNDGWRALGSKVAKNGAAIGSLGITVKDPDAVEEPGDVPEVNAKTGRKLSNPQVAALRRELLLKKESEHDIADEETFWKRLGIDPIPPSRRR